jgi:hypothetical protein
MVQGLVEASRAGDLREIVVVNAPHRVHGVPVVADWSSAVRLSGGGSVQVVAAPSVDYASARDRILDGPPASTPRFLEIDSVIPRRLYSRYGAPPFPAGSNRLERDFGTIELGPGGTLRVRIRSSSDPTRAVWLWSEGKLARLM